MENCGTEKVSIIRNIKDYHKINQFESLSGEMLKRNMTGESRPGALHFTEGAPTSGQLESNKTGSIGINSTSKNLLLNDETEKLKIRHAILDVKLDS